MNIGKQMLSILALCLLFAANAFPTDFTVAVEGKTYTFRVDDTAPIGQQPLASSVDWKKVMETYLPGFVQVMDVPEVVLIKWHENPNYPGFLANWLTPAVYIPHRQVLPPKDNIYDLGFYLTFWHEVSHTRVAAVNAQAVGEGLADGIRDSAFCKLNLTNPNIPCSNIIGDLDMQRQGSKEAKGGLASNIRRGIDYTLGSGILLTATRGDFRPVSQAMLKLYERKKFEDIVYQDYFDIIDPLTQPFDGKKYSERMRSSPVGYFFGRPGLHFDLSVSTLVQRDRLGRKAFMGSALMNGDEWVSPNPYLSGFEGSTPWNHPPYGRYKVRMTDLEGRQFYEESKEAKNALSDGLPSLRAQERPSGAYQAHGCWHPDDASDCDFGNPSLNAKTYFVVYHTTSATSQDWLVIVANGPGFDDFGRLDLDKFIVKGESSLTVDKIPGALVIKMNGARSDVAVSYGGKIRTLTPTDYPRVIPWTERPFVAAVTDAASFQHKPLVPGSIYTIFGTDLLAMAPTLAKLDDAGMLPTTIGGMQVVISSPSRANDWWVEKDDKKEYLCPLFYADQSQINFQVPAELPPGPAEIRVILNGEPGTSNKTEVQTTKADPGLFVTDWNLKIAAATVAEAGPRYGQVISRFNPANPGEILSLWATGLGPVSPELTTGKPCDRESVTTDPVTVMVGETPAEVLWSGLAPGFVGLYQINVRLPQSSAGLAPVALYTYPAKPSETVLPVR